MSSILFYVFLSLTLFYLVFFILNSIFSFKNNAKLKKIFQILQSSFLLLSFTAIMIFFLPNSRNLMRITLSFLILSLTGFSFTQDGTKNSFKYTGNILILLSLAALFKLFLPSIRLTKISGIAFLLTIILYVLLSVLSLFNIGKKRIGYASFILWQCKTSVFICIKFFCAPYADFWQNALFHYFLRRNFYSFNFISFWSCRKAKGFFSAFFFFPHISFHISLTDFTFRFSFYADLTKKTSKNFNSNFQNHI